MPQRDLDIIEDFIFFAFTAFLLGLGDDETEESVISRHADAHLAEYYLSTQKELRAETELLTKAARIV